MGKTKVIKAGSDTIRVLDLTEEEMVKAVYETRKVPNKVEKFTNTMMNINSNFNDMQTTANIQNMATEPLMAMPIERSVTNSGIQAEPQENSKEKKLPGIATMNLSKAVITGAIGFGKITAFADEIAQSNFQIQNMTGSLETANAMQEQIFRTAQMTRTPYLEVADTIAGFGEASENFANTDEMIKFAELANKSLQLGGASSAEQSTGMQGLVQSAQSGNVSIADYTAMTEANPALKDSIQRETNMSEQEITVAINAGELDFGAVKNAVLSMGEEINTQFANMPMTWGDVWETTMNKVLKISMPLLNFLNMLAQNWSVIEPIVIGVVIALGAYAIVMGAVNAINAVRELSGQIAIAQEKMKAVATNQATAATFAGIAVQCGFNAALLACPITWVVGIIIAAIAIFYALIAVINKLTGTSYSATGLITGAFMTMVAVIGNIFFGLVEIIGGCIELVWNFFAFIANFLCNAVNNPIGAIMVLFLDLFDFVLGIMQKIAQAIDMVFQTDMASQVIDFRTSVSATTDEMIGTCGSGDYKDVVAKLDFDEQMEKLGLGIKAIDYNEYYDKGYAAGENFDSKISGAIPKMSPMPSITNPTGNIAYPMNPESYNNSNVQYPIDLESYNNSNIQYPADLSSVDISNWKTSVNIDNVSMTQDEVYTVKNIPGMNPAVNTAYPQINNSQPDIDMEAMRLAMGSQSNDVVNNFEVNVDVGGITQYVKNGTGIGEVVATLEDALRKGLQVAAESAFAV